MNTLILDCAYGSTAAILKDGKLLNEEHGEGQRQADNYLQVIDKAIKASGLSLDEIDNLLINVGPGSFTGLRVALSVAKGLGFNQKVKYSTFNSFDYIKEGEVKVLDGFSSFVYIKDKDGMSCRQIDELKNKTCYCVSTDLKSRLDKENIKAILSKKASYEEISKQAKSCALKDIAPLYLRASQAELQLEKRKNK